MITINTTIITITTMFPACHCNIKLNIKAFNMVTNITSMMILQMVSMGMVMKQMMVSAMVRWNTK